MTAFAAPEITFHCYDAHNLLIDPDQAVNDGFGDPKAIVSDEIEDLQEAIDTLAIKKPSWLHQAEQQARGFMGSLALENLNDVYLLREGSPQQRDFLWLGDTTVAITYSFVSWVLLRQPALKQLYKTQGQVGVSATLVHEFVHSSLAAPTTIGARYLEDGTLDHRYRTGLMTVSRSRVRGSLFEEGFAGLVAGWFQRCQDDPLAPPVVLYKYPTLALPDHLKPANPEMISGYDAYTLELIAGGLQKAAIMSASSFVANLFDTRRPESSVAGLRTHAQAIEALEPGLYPYLRDLEYSKENWQAACQRVLDIVSRPVSLKRLVR